MTRENVQLRSNRLWGVLGLLLGIGTVGAGFFVWGLTDFVATDRALVDVPVSLAGALLAGVSFLFVSGILYRVDRLRDAVHQQVRLFD